MIKIKLVTNNDTRPNGLPDECFYCNEKIGKPHKFECVVLRHKVKIRFIFDIETSEPVSWDKDTIEFHYNEGAWCANNAIGMLDKFAGRLARQKKCLCSCFKAEVIDTKIK